MTIKFSEEFHIDTVAIKQFGFFDIVLDIDTRVFIDPALLKHCSVPEFSNASKKVTQFFSDIICLLQHSNHENDLCWKEADKRLTFHELTGTCIGYSEHGTSGKAIGPVLRTNILKTVKTILNLGECNPRLFELLGVFQNNFGCDRISDLMTFILREEIYMYTSRVCTECGIDNTI